MLTNIQRKKVLQLGSSITQLLRTLKLYDIITYKTQKNDRGKGAHSKIPSD